MIGKTTYLYNICSFPQCPAAVMTIIASVKKVFIISDNLLHTCSGEMITKMLKIMTMGLTMTLTMITTRVQWGASTYSGVSN